jgi:carbonic anhydrase
LLALPAAARADEPHQTAPAQQAAPAAGGAHHWGYDGAEGPAHWGDHAPECKTGKQQSPINLQTKGKHRAKKTDLPRIGFQWAKVKGTLVNNGHTIQVNLEPGNSIDVSGTKYELAQFHFHTPSEHLVDGHHTALEVHFVHKTAEGKLAVVGILIDEKGAANAAMQPVFAALDKPGAIDVDLPAILPRKHLYFNYPGSLTTPPCSEGVNWIVLKERLHTSAASVKAFKKIFPHNARPAQEVGERVVQVDTKD